MELSVQSQGLKEGSEEEEDTSIEMDRNKVEFQPEDEVCIICNGELIFGTVERTKRSEVSSSSTNEWSVKWIGRSDLKTRTVVKEDQMTLTDRPLYKGCRVRRADKPNGLIGICRSVNLFADLRVVGTTTILEQTNIIRFRHLKEFKQKSVVYQNGWLGVITEVNRSAKVRLSNGSFSKVPLSRVQALSPFIVEPPWINESVVNPARVINQSRFESGQPIYPASIDGQSALYIEDLEVDSVKVVWRYRVDVFSPDAPSTVIKAEKLAKLKVVKEECDSETTFQMGNLGRYFLRSADELKSLEEYERKFVQANLPSQFKDLNRNRSPPARAYEKDPEKRLVAESSIVVEIVHLSGTGDIMWQDKTMEFVKSTDLVVLKESLLSTEIVAGTFIFSKRFIDRTAEDVYGVVQMTDISKQTVTLLLLSCDDPPKVIEQTMTLNQFDVFPHPRYKYFNESSTIVSTQQNDGSVRIGNVLDTNLSGKVFVHWIDTDRDEWCWPSQCSVFSVKGFDLECIISLINDADEVKDCPSKKFHKVLEKLKSISKIWSNAEAENTDERQESLGSLKYVITACQTAEAAVGKPGKYFSSIKRHSNLLNSSEINCADASIRSNVKTLCEDLVQEGDILYTVLLEVDSNSPTKVGNTASEESGVKNSTAKSSASSSHVPMEVDNQANLPPESRESLMCQFDDARKSGIFVDRVLVDSNHPSTHQYASKTEFTPEHQRCFLSTVKRELENLRSSYAPGLKIRTFCDRYDLYSIAICGPERTPYENSLYLFDAVLPASYPAVPPQFHFLSYGAGRLNPNLYAEGKVCVSLLGTWAGKNPQEKWTKESNLFQVLLSIQALILVNEPYHNEPGLEEHNCTVGTVNQRRHEYNAHLMPKVANMMLTQIQRPGEPWVDDIKKFYIEHVPKFISRWNKWFEAAESTKDETEFLAKLPEPERPGFVIYPFSASFTTQMKQAVVKLEGAWKKLTTEQPDELGAEGEPNCAVPEDHPVPQFQDNAETVVSSTFQADPIPFELQ